jgi:hypothetical protein
MPCNTLAGTACEPAGTTCASSRLGGGHAGDRSVRSSPSGGAPAPDLLAGPTADTRLQSCLATNGPRATPCVMTKLVRRPARLGQRKICGGDWRSLSQVSTGSANRNMCSDAEKSNGCDTLTLPAVLLG